MQHLHDLATGTGALDLPGLKAFSKKLGAFRSSKDDEEANERVPKGFKTLKPYLRVTPQPNK